MFSSFAAEMQRGVPDEELDLDCFNRLRNLSNPDPDDFDPRASWQPEEVALDEERILVLDQG